MTIVQEYSLVPYYVSEVLTYVAWSGAGYLAWRAVRAYERRSVEAGRLHMLGKQVRRLEASMARIDRRAAWAVDAQQFTTALLLGQSKPAVLGSGEQQGRPLSEPPAT